MVPFCGSGSPLTTDVERTQTLHLYFGPGDNTNESSRMPLGELSRQTCWRKIFLCGEANKERMMKVPANEVHWMVVGALREGNTKFVYH